jgi:TolB-like protein
MESDSTPSLEPATQVIAGRYEVIGLLGVGGMGAVYKVRDLDLDEIVALKMLKRELALAPGVAERFRREVKLARRVTHPNVARTFDLGEHAGERFLTMELVQGESLATRIAREGPLSVADTVEIVSAICAGLDAAHAAGVVHRDLKPDNVLIAPASPTSKGLRVVITDFGVARAEETGGPRSGVPVGTPAYMAPEQVEASAEIDARADVYALGAVMFEMLTGRLPFEGPTVFAVAATRLTQPPPDPRVHRPELPEALALFVRRSMARRPIDRPQSAREVAARLATITVPVDALARTGETDSAETFRIDQKTVAVLPFRYAGPREDAYLVEGLTDDIVDALSVTPGLRVRPRGLVLQLAAGRSAVDPRSLGRDLDVQVVVEGTMRTSEAAVRVNVRVLSVEDGFQVWAARFEGARADVLRIAEDASRAIAEALTVRKPTRAELVSDPVAIDLYLRGRHEFMRFWAGANERAIELLKEAHERAPGDGLILAGYAAALSRHFGLSETPEQFDAARAVADLAARVAPRLGETHSALANVRLHEGDPVAAAASVMRALSLAPLLPDAHEMRARLLAEVADPTETLEAAARAVQLEPRLAHLRHTIVGRAYAMLGDWDEVDRVLGAPPSEDNGASLYWLARTRLAVWKGSDDAIACVLEETVRAPAFSTNVLVRSVCQSMKERRVPDALLAYLRTRADTAPTVRIRSFWLQVATEMKTYVGDLPAALADVESSVNLGLFDVMWTDRCPVLAPLRELPRWKDVRATVAERAARVLGELHGGAATLAG